MKEDSFRLDIRKRLGRNYFSEVGEVLEWAAERSHGCSIPGRVPNKFGWGSERHSLVESSLPMAEGLKLDDIKGPLPTVTIFFSFYISML